jgi:hypothetical protein
VRCRNGRESSFEAQFYHPEEKKSVSIGLFYFKCPEDMEACEIEAARALDRVAFKFYDEKGWSIDRIQGKLSVRSRSGPDSSQGISVATLLAQAVK